MAKEYVEKGFIWNPSTCDCKCDKLCDVGEYLDYRNCKCRNKLVNKLVEEWSANIDENEMIYNGTSNDYKNPYNSCTIYIALFVIAFLRIFSISSAFTYFHWFLKKDNINGKYQRNLY